MTAPIHSVASSAGATINGQVERPSQRELFFSNHTSLPGGLPASVVMHPVVLHAYGPRTHVGLVIDLLCC